MSNEVQKGNLAKPMLAATTGIFKAATVTSGALGVKTKFNQGFKSKQNCEDWMNEKRNNYGLDWRVGFMVKFKKFNEPWVLVDRKGNEVKCW